MADRVSTFILGELAKSGSDVGGSADILGRSVSSLGLDSLDFMELLNDIEEQFAVRLEDDTVSATTTVADLIAFIEGKVAIRDAGAPTARP